MSNEFEFSTELDPIDAFTVVDEIEEGIDLDLSNETDKNAVIDLDPPEKENGLTTEEPIKTEPAEGAEDDKQADETQEEKQLLNDVDEEGEQIGEILEEGAEQTNINKTDEVKEDIVVLLDEDSNEEDDKYDPEEALKSDSEDDEEEEEETKVEEEEGSTTEAPPHPYTYLVDTFEYLNEQLTLSPIEAPKSLEETEYCMVSNKALLIKMLERLRNVKEIGVHVHTSKYYYKDAICFIQISTKDTDYSVDAIKLKHEMLMLTEIFINPKILKIVYRAKTVIATLQNDLHLYMVNIFDVERARHTLEDTRNRSLNAVLKLDYKIDTGASKFQAKFDLRQRPLPEEYIKFCRTGAHYLPMLYHEYKNKILAKGKDVYMKFLDECRAASKQTYTDTKTAIFATMERDLKNQHKCELHVLQQLYDWRRKLAEKLNVNQDTILKNQCLMKLVKALTYETEELHILAQSGYVRKDVEEVKAIIWAARAKFNVHGKYLLRYKPVPNKPSPAQPKNQQKWKANQSTPVNNQQKRKLSQHQQMANQANMLQQRKINQQLQMLNQANMAQQRKINQQQQQILNQAKNPQKRKMNQQQPIPNKQMKIEPLMDNRVTPRKNNQRRKKAVVKNFNTFNKPATPQKKFNRGNNSAGYTRSLPSNSNLTSSRFEMNQWQPNSNQKVNPTNIPSSFTFQGQSSGSNFMDYGGSDFGFNSFGNSGQSNAGDDLFQTLLEFNQSRSRLSQNDDYDSRRFQSRSPIEDKIDLLERRVNNSQSRNRSGNTRSRYYSNSSNSSNRRRY